MKIGQERDPEVVFLHRLHDEMDGLETARHIKPTSDIAGPIWATRSSTAAFNR